MPGYELLLKTALLDRDQALAAWEQWHGSTDLDRIDAASYWLLPLVHRKLIALGVEHPDLDRMKGVRRQTWLKNQLSIKAGMGAILALNKAGMETLVPKGAASLEGYDHDTGLRPMAGCDVLVRETCAADALRVLEAIGWARVTSAPSALTTRFCSFRSSLVLRNSSGSELRLHWHVLSRCCSSAADQGFWANSNRAIFQGVETRTFAPSDQLISTCLSGMEWSDTPAVWWIADATEILKMPGLIKGERILRFARDCRLVLPIRRALEYLQTALDAPIPEDLLRALAAERTSPADRLELESISMPFRQRRLRAWVVGCHRRRRRSGLGSLLGFLGCALRWGALPHMVARIRKQPVPD